MIDECITWKDHIRTVGNKIEKKYRIIVSSQTITQYKFLEKYLFFVYSYILTTQTLHGQAHNKLN